MLFDNHNRIVNYLRLAVTDRCNLRCWYCMPAEQMNFLPRRELLTWEEMLRVVRILAPMGIEKVRLTGGEPFLRRDFMYFLSELVKIEGIRRVNLTTNGTATLPHVEQLKKLGVRSINLSLDTLDRARFTSLRAATCCPKSWLASKRCWRRVSI